MMEADKGLCARRLRLWIGIWLAPLLAAATGTASGQSTDNLERQMLSDCQVVAKALNRSKHVGIEADGIRPILTWHAACAERPPTGPGNVTALWEGISKMGKGAAQGVFFWQKVKHGKYNRGFFMCTR